MEEFLKVAAPVAQALATCITAVFAIAGLNAWRRQMTGKRKFEIAEQVLAAVFRAEGAIKQIRSPLGYEGEGKDRKRDPSEPEGVARLKDSYFAIFARIRDREEVFIELQKLASLSRVHLGMSVGNAIEDIFRVLSRISAAASMLVTDTGTGARREDPKIFKEWEETIWMRQGDQIAVEVKGLVEKIEQLCAPHLG